VSIYRKSDVYLVPCPDCKAQRGQLCRGLRGRLLHTDTHWTRREMAHIHVSRLALADKLDGERAAFMAEHPSLFITKHAREAAPSIVQNKKGDL